MFHWNQFKFQYWFSGPNCRSLQMPIHLKSQIQFLSRCRTFPLFPKNNIILMCIICIKICFFFEFLFIQVESRLIDVLPCNIAVKIRLEQNTWTFLCNFFFCCFNEEISWHLNRCYYLAASTIKCFHSE